jgi:hypothetical protein
MINEESTSFSSCCLHICRTGEKEQYYTLYLEGVSVGKYHYNYFCDYQQNLSHNKTHALAKAQARMMELYASNYWRSVELEFHESPRIIYDRMEAFGTEFKTAKSGKVMWALATQEFWALWKSSKQEIKDAGFWVTKFDGGQWRVFCKKVKMDWS